MEAPLKVAAVSLNQTALDFRGNTARILAALSVLRSEGVGICCFPELSICGYGCDDWFSSESAISRSWQCLEEIAAATSGLLAVVGLPLQVEGITYNVAAVCSDGRVLALVPKQHLPDYGVHYEQRYFSPWPRGKVSELIVQGLSVPVAAQPFDYRGLRCAIEICEDAWVKQRPLNEYATAGVELVLNPSASHFAFGKHQLRRQLLQSSCVGSVRSYLYANLIGVEAGRIIYDGGSMVASRGQVVAESTRFSMRDWEFAVAEFSYQETEGASLVDLDKDEEFVGALRLGLYDYLRKSRAQRYVLSLSGGADSSTIACLVSAFGKQMTLELSAAEILKRFPGLDLKKPLCEQLLTCAYQGTAQSSSATRESARSLAMSLGARYFEFDVDGLVDQYRSMIEGQVGRSLTWSQDDLALQNLQARVRAPAIWLLANIQGGLLLTTSNRSEGAVGYATMDGDTAGGLCPLGGVDKAYLRNFLRRLEKEVIAGFGPVPALSLVNSLPPSAELRPLESKQTDENDLMPYEVLDVIERYAVGQKFSPRHCLDLTRKRFADVYSDAALVAWTKKFFKLWSQSQWKRERLAPTFQLDEYNVAATTGCRFPILNGGFTDELDDL